MEVASYVPFHFQKGVTTVAWNMSSISCREDESWFIYSLFETEQWLQLESSRIYDDDMDNDMPVRMACLYTYSDVRPDSIRAIPVNASCRYTLVLFNTNDKPVKVSGEVTAFFRVNGPPTLPVSMRLTSSTPQLLLCSQVASPPLP